MITNAATDYSGDILWSDAKYGNDLEFLLDMDVPFHIDTNGVFLDIGITRRLLSSKVRSINVSIDAGRDETFRRIRKGAPPLQQIIAKMKGLSAERTAFGRRDCRLSASFTLMRSNVDELMDFVQIVRDSEFDVAFTRHVEAYTPEMSNESLWFHQLLYNVARERALEFASKLGVELLMPRPFEPRPENRGRGFCPEPWRSAVILGNGDVRACCMPGEETLMGNLNKMSLEEIWNGDVYQAFRMRVNAADAPKICSICPFVRKDNNGLTYRPYLAIDHLD